MRHWLETNGITHVAMESTGVFWVPVYTILERTIPNVWIVNARHIKYVPGHKTDKKDSAWISKLLLAGLLEPSFIPPLDQRNLRELTRRRRKLVQEISSEKNRLLQVLNSATSNWRVWCRTWTVKWRPSCLTGYASGQEVTMEYINSVYHGSLQATREELYEACRGRLKMTISFWYTSSRRISMKWRSSWIKSAREWLPNLRRTVPRWTS